VGPENLWSKTPLEVNQLLHELLRGLSMVGLNRKVVGLQQIDKIKGGV
jgi:hypothetical protein